MFTAVTYNKVGLFLAKVINSSVVKLAILPTNYTKECVKITIISWHVYYTFLGYKSIVLVYPNGPIFYGLVFRL